MYQHVSLIFMVKQWLAQPLADVCGTGSALEFHGGELGEGVLIQVIVVLIRDVHRHGSLVQVKHLQRCALSLNVLRAQPRTLPAELKSVTKVTV